jgi:pyruvate dehydrogenase E2 component (dihydrolipoamide acetyltransferase)
MSIFTLPDLGEGLDEAEIVSWHVTAGDHVVMDQPLVSVETDKAVLDIPSPRAGRVAALHGEPGDVVKVGAPLVDFAGDETTEDAGTVVGSLPEVSRENVRPVVESHGGAPRSLQATPAVRALASRLSIDLSTISGSGPGGTITREDVQGAADSASAARPVTQDLRGVRRAMARNMSAAGEHVVPATLTDVAQVHHWPETESPVIRLVRAMVAASAAEPGLNAWYLEHEEQLIRHRQVHLGIATDTADGLFVPVLRNAGELDDGALDAALDRLKRDLTGRRLPATALRGATITLSNFGSIGGEHATLVVLPPQVAILGAGHLAERVVVDDGEAVVRRTLPLSLTFDHRVVTGGEAARFMAAAIKDLQRGAE